LQGNHSPSSSARAPTCNRVQDKTDARAFLLDDSPNEFEQLLCGIIL